MSDSFDDARSLFLDGVGCFQAGRFEEAQGRFRESLALLPGRASTLMNLGATLLKLGRPEEALVALDQSLAAEPGNVEALCHRGVALGLLGRHDEALACFDRALAGDGAQAAAWHRRGLALHGLDRHEEALESFGKALAIAPDMADAWSHRGTLLKDLGRLEEAAVAFEHAIAQGADPQVHSYFLAGVREQATPDRAPGHYVEHLFDEYAEKFDEHLVGVLNYRAHAALTEYLGAMDGRRFGRALDMGCGTGLCGPLLRRFVDLIDGVDLSGKMIGKARERGVYADLVQADLVAYLQDTTRRYELALSADAFIYIGDLQAVFAGVNAVLEPGGIFSFSAERADDDRDFALRTSLRYAHSERYVRQLAQNNGFDVIDIVRSPIREDQRQPIDGLLVYLQKT
jgi:predicted TPR repeat methyltransferase